MMSLFGVKNDNRPVPYEHFIDQFKEKTFDEANFQWKREEEANGHQNVR